MTYLVSLATAFRYLATGFMVEIGGITADRYFNKRAKPLLCLSSPVLGVLCCLFFIIFSSYRLGLLRFLSRCFYADVLYLASQYLQVLLIQSLG